MKFFLSLFLFGLSWLGSIFPNTETSTLPQWEQQAIKYGEGDPELECLYREILFNFHQRNEQQRNRINLLMHLEVLPHAELHARDRILDGLMAEHEHQSDQQLIQTDTIKNDQTLKNLQKLEEEKDKREKKDKDCGKYATSVLEAFCMDIKHFVKTDDSQATEKAKQNVLSSLDNAACITEKDIREGKRKELLQKFWNENQEKLFCAHDTNTEHVLVRIIEKLIENKNPEFIDYFIQNELDLTIDLAKAHPLDDKKTPYTIMDYFDLQINQLENKIDKTDREITKLSLYNRFRTGFEKLFDQKYPNARRRLRS